MDKDKPSFYIESYGCQMNISDSEIVVSILLEKGYSLTYDLKKAHLILLNTCSIRKKAFLTIKNRLENLKYLKIKNKQFPLFGILGCISKTTEKSFLDKIDFFVDPDDYRNISNVIDSVINKGSKSYIPSFSFKKNYKDETYEGIEPYFPFKKKQSKVTSFLSITRGCDNMCTFCIVPFTRGRERSKSPSYIIEECQKLYEQGYKEITLLGQNVDSYLWFGGRLKKEIKNSKKIEKKIIDFSNLLDLIAKEFPSMRIRFSTSNPQDMSYEVIEIMSKHSNICKHIHLPVQSGSNKILKIMNRKYTREIYISLIKRIRSIIPECSISHDIMAGFCHETEEDHQETLSLMNEVKYNYGYMFSYSPRPGTFSYKKLKDTVPIRVKKRRLKEIIELQKTHSIFHMKKFLGKTEKVLIEGESKKNHNNWYGRNTQNIVVVFPKKNTKIGETILIKIINFSSATLIGKIENKHSNCSN
ncbi:tRNA (N6-isopentenyl adenosine(37)-C2)-methylthiotransferase MiaB [Blattabacterium cuenoti]|uniref:tRNA (N6-isopentenyl adenosine(37)-C2)-methylthiotransferase MiaB n=1 Tax=Blattabacterium cuenoti TaxID=1653831 RepID=UPI00163B9F1A|nr:tRNA (N6-isopentenyl adenosine(37)-C2)-methylthiotransferase MiaB [Blattabacterium cuenoti]